ncbi:MAG: hypothetical protein JWP95_1291, partial [Actinotalea sp.]|nr:hypothetical protein [Actinotalea sp.]
YVVGELAVTVHVLAWDRATGLAEPVGALPAWAGAEQSASEHATTEQGTTVLPAHLETSGDRVLVSVRGADVVACFAVRDDGARLEHTGDVPVGGRWPRHFAVVGTGPGRRVVAALQESGRLAALPWPSTRPGGIEGAVGVEGAPGVGGAGSVGSLVGGDGLAVPYPACVVPVVEPGPAER